MRDTFFRDGYTRRARINAAPGLHGELNFSYRPLLVDQRDDITKLVLDKRQTTKQVYDAMSSMMAGQITQWDASAERDGEEVAINAANVRRLPPALFDRVFDVICGAKPHDLPDEPTPDEVSDFIKGLTADQQQGSDAKN
jgi:hypothetical protein